MALSRGKDGKRQPLLRLGSLPKTKPYEADKGSNSALNVDDPVKITRYFTMVDIKLMPIPV